MQMENQKSYVYEEKFLIKRYGDEPIEITDTQKQGILRGLVEGAKYVMVGKYVLMLNGIKSIDPKYEPDNIPPRPKAKYAGAIEWGGDGSPMIRNENYDLRPAVPTNQAELEVWDSMFAQKKLKGSA